MVNDLGVLNRHTRKFAPEAVEPAGVGRRRLAVEEAAAGEDEGSGADGGDDLRRRLAGKDKVDQRLMAVFTLLARARAAGNDEKVERRAVSGKKGRLDQEAADAGHFRLFGDGQGVEVEVTLTPPCTAEDLKRSGEIEHLDAIEDEDAGTRPPRLCPGHAGERIAGVASKATAASS